MRQATIADLERIVPLFNEYRRFYGQRSSLGRARAFLAERIARRESVILLVVATLHGSDGHDAALGFVQLYPVFSSVSTGRVWILNDLFVAPAARGRGVATSLMRSARRFARRTGAVRIELATAHDNSRARRLYAALGYREDTVFVRYELVP